MSILSMSLWKWLWTVLQYLGKGNLRICSTCPSKDFLFFLMFFFSSSHWVEFKKIWCSYFLLSCYTEGSLCLLRNICYRKNLNETLELVVMQILPLVTMQNCSSVPPSGSCLGLEPKENSPCCSAEMKSDGRIVLETASPVLQTLVHKSSHYIMTVSH